MRYSFRILFYLRKKSSYQSDLSTIYVRITINGKLVEFSSKMKTIASQWDQKKQKMLGRTQDAHKINSSLIKISSRLNKLFDELTEKEGIPTPERLKDAFFSGNNGDKEYLLLTMFEKLISQKQELADNDAIKADSVNTYTCTKNKLISYIKLQYYQAEIDIRKVDYEFINGFEIYLKGKVQCGHNTMVRHMRHLKQVTTYAYKNGYMTKDPFYNIALSVKKVERTFLTEEELKKVINLKLTDETLQKVKDVFVFQCLCGLSYIDVKQLKHSDIVDGTIIIHRQKTGNKSFIPILQIAQILIDKYTTVQKPDMCVFPVYTSQRMNIYLKTIGKLAGLNKKFSTHCGRHTFGTLMISKGVPIESVSKMLGHTELKTTMIYAKILDSKVIKDIKQVDGQLIDLTNAMREQQ